MRSQPLWVIFLVLIPSATKLVQVAHIFRYIWSIHIQVTEPVYDGLEQKSKWGQILPSGIRQHYNLGRMLRKEYIDELGFLNPDYDPAEFYVRSTDIDRTLVSAQSQMMGMYPSGPTINVTEDYLLPPYLDSKNFLQETNALPNNVQPIPIKIEPFNYQILVPNCAASAKLLQQDNKLLQQTIAEFEEQTRDAKIRICAAFGVDQAGCLNTYTIYQLFDVYQSDLYQGRDVPKLSEDDIGMFKLLTSFAFYSYSGGINYSKYLSLPFFNDVLGKFSNRISNPESTLKWVSYSAHDGNIIRAARVLNISSPECLFQRLQQDYSQPCQMQPKYASNIIFELYQDDISASQEQYFVKVKYDGKYQSICDGEFSCPYHVFEQRLRDVLPTTEEFTSMCNTANVDPFVDNVNPQKSKVSDKPKPPDAALRSIMDQPDVVIVNNNMIFNLRGNYEE